MAERSVRRQGKAGNWFGLRGRANDWLLMREFHDGPERTAPPDEAGYMTAADFLSAINGGAHTCALTSLRSPYMSSYMMLHSLLAPAISLHSVVPVAGVVFVHPIFFFPCHALPTGYFPRWPGSILGT